MKNPLTILVVEDRPEHLKDVMAVIDSAKLPIELRTYYASDLANALTILPTVDAVMTDVFFPCGNVPLRTLERHTATLLVQLQYGHFNRLNGVNPHGMIVVHKALTAAKPVVWVTSTYHHGKGTNEASKWGRDRGLEMFDSGSMNVNEAPHKPWKEALVSLLALVMGLEMGEYAIDSQKGIFLGPENEGQREILSGYVLNDFAEELVKGTYAGEVRFPEEGGKRVIDEMIKQGFWPN